MSEFNVGDLVEAVRGETLIRGRVDINVGELYIGEPDAIGQFLEWLTAAGFTLSLVEAATPALPTEAGIYEGASGVLYSLMHNGPTVTVTFSTLDDGLAITDAEVRDDMPLVKLEPVPVTAKKVLDAVGAWAFGPGREEIGDLITRLERQFGVKP